MNREKVTHDYILRGLNCLPQPIVDSEVKKMIREYLKGKYGGLSLEEVWSHKVKEHEEYWNTRFALNLGYRLFRNNDRIHGHWDDYKIYVQIGGHRPLTITYQEKITSDMILMKLEKLCIRYLARFNYDSLSIPKRTFNFKDYPTPEFDWVIWREKALLSIEHNSAFTHYSIDSIIRKFKSGKLSGNPDEYLREQIRLSYQD